MDFGICGGSRNQSPKDTEGWLYIISFCVWMLSLLDCKQNEKKKKNTWFFSSLHPLLLELCLTLSISYIHAYRMK